MRGVISDQLVCTKCWKWYDGRTLCPTCRVPLVSPDTGKPLPEVEAPPGPTSLDARPGWRPAGDGPAFAGKAWWSPLPRMSGYPTGTPVTAPTRIELKHYLVDEPGAAPPHRDPWRPGWRCRRRPPEASPHPRISRRRPPRRRPSTRRPPARRPAAPPWPAPDRRSALSVPLSPARRHPLPGARRRTGGRDVGGPPAELGRLAPVPRRTGWPSGGRVTPAPGPGPRSLGAAAPTAPPGRTEALPLGWHPGVSLGRPIAAAPPSADPQAPGFPLPLSRPLPTLPASLARDAPSWSAAVQTPDHPPAPPAPAPAPMVWPAVADLPERPIAPPPPSVDATASMVPASPPFSAGTFEAVEDTPPMVPAPPPFSTGPFEAVEATPPKVPAPPPFSVGPFEAWPLPVPDAPGAPLPAAAAAAPVVVPPVGRPPGPPPAAAPWAGAADLGPPLVVREAVHPEASPERFEPLPPPPPLPAGPAPAALGTGSPTQQTGLLPAALVALVVSLAVAALWVAATVQTDLLLPELAIVVGVAAGLVIRRSARRGGFGAAISAIVIALVAIAVGLALAALAIHSAGEGVTLQTGLQTFTGSLLPQLRDEVGLTGVALGVAGVLVAGLLTTIRRD